VHGEFAAAFGLNALAVTGYAVFAVLWVMWVSREARGRSFTVRLRPAHWWAVGVVVLAFEIVRNLSFGSALAP
jgi:hypothetical protein